MQAKDILPRHVNPRKLAFHGAVLEGSVPSDNLSRLLGLSEKVENLIARLAFKVDEQGRQIVSGTISVAIELQCQRCLKSVTHHLNSAFDVAVIREEADAEQLSTKLDPWIVAVEDEGDLYHLIEEEILLSVPLVPMHAEFCVDEKLYSSETELESTDDNPFSILKQWQKGSNE